MKRSAATTARIWQKQRGFGSAVFWAHAAVGSWLSWLAVCSFVVVRRCGIRRTRCICGDCMRVVVNPVGQAALRIVGSHTRCAMASVAFQTQNRRAGRFRDSTMFTGQFHASHVRAGLKSFGCSAGSRRADWRLLRSLERKKLYVILGPGACKDDCSSVLTSKREFDRAIREKNEHQ